MGWVRWGLGLLLCSLSVEVAAVADARALGRGGAGLVSGDRAYLAGNPALLATTREGVAELLLGGGVAVYDGDRVLDGIDSLQRDLDQLTAWQSLDPALPGRIDAQLRQLSRQPVQGELGAVTAAVISRLPLALVVRNDTRLAARLHYDDRDAALLAAPLPGIEQEDLHSRMRGSGVAISEVALMGALSTEHDVLGTFHWGATLALQDVRLLHYDARIAEFDEYEIADSRHREDRQGTNLDFGVLKPLGRYALALRWRNLVPVSYRGPEQSRYRMRPELALGAGARWGALQAELDVELVPRPGYGEVVGTQYAQAGLELGVRWLGQLRVGYRHDLQ